MPSPVIPINTASAFIHNLEREVDVAFDAYMAMLHEYPGKEWSHIVEPLHRRWKEAEQAADLLRLGWTR